MTCEVPQCEKPARFSAMGRMFCILCALEVQGHLKRDVERIARMVGQNQHASDECFGAVTDERPRMAKEEPGQCAG